jgi:hypothetical protein
MQYMCKKRKKPCSDIIEHIRKVHNFSNASIKSSLEHNPNSFKNAFEEIK